MNYSLGKIDKYTALGDYKVLKKAIGKGSFSKIYKGFSENGDSVAIKIIKKKNVKDEKYILREIEVMKTLNHINILGLLNVLVSDNKYYLILQYCSFGDLKEYTKRMILNEAKLKFFMKQIKNGLCELYKNNIIHRDLKPQNILVYRNEILKISDFGFAKAYSRELNMQQTMCGSPLYMAPEILQYKPYTDKADLWSVGVIMYELFFKKTPIEGTTLHNLVSNMKGYIFKIKNGKLSANCEDLLKTLLQKNPEKRIEWEEFFRHNWFNSIQKKKEKINDSIFTMDEEIDILEDNVKDNLDYCNLSDDEEDSSKLKLSDTYLSIDNLKEKNIEAEENYVIISSPLDIETIPIPIQNRNRSRTQSITKIFTSLKDSISYMFGPRSF